MATAVLIKYVGPATELDRKGMEIARYFEPTNSYVDSPVYTEGYDPTATGSYAEGEAYGKSIYATNVAGWGNLPGLIPMNSTTTKFAQFERAIFKALEAKAAGTANVGITFEIDTYEDEIYWNQIARNMADEGFYIEVGDEKYGEDDESGDDDGEGG